MVFGEVNTRKYAISERRFFKESQHSMLRHFIKTLLGKAFLLVEEKHPRFRDFRTDALRGEPHVSHFGETNKRLSKIAKLRSIIFFQNECLSV